MLTTKEMRGIGQGKRGRGGTSCGRENFQGRGNSGATSQPHIHTRRVSDASVEIGQPSNPSQAPLQSRRVSLETQSSRNVAETVHCSPEAENCASCSAVCHHSMLLGMTTSLLWHSLTPSIALTLVPRL